MCAYLSNAWNHRGVENYFPCKSYIYIGNTKPQIISTKSSVKPIVEQKLPYCVQILCCSFKTKANDLYYCRKYDSSSNVPCRSTAVRRRVYAISLHVRVGIMTCYVSRSTCVFCNYSCFLFVLREKPPPGLRTSHNYSEIR